MHAFLISTYDDESSVLALILQKAGFSVRTIHNISQLTGSWPEQSVDFILFAVAEEKDPFLKEIKHLRQHTTAPFLAISNSNDENHQIALLDAGVDCLIIRPYRVRFLLAQIMAMMRRTQGTSLFYLPSLSQGDVTLDPSTRMVTAGLKEPVRLTHLEFRLLHTLLTNPGQIIPTENLVEYVWGYSGEGNRDLVRGLVQRLRSKMEPDPGKPIYIINSPGIGYYFQVENQG